MSISAIDTQKNLDFVDAKLELGAFKCEKKETETDGIPDDVYEYQNGNIWVRDGIIRLVEAPDCMQGGMMRIPGRVVGVAANASSGKFLGSNYGLGHGYFSFATGVVSTYNDPAQAAVHPPTFGLSDTSGVCPTGDSTGK